MTLLKKSCLLACVLALGCGTDDAGSRTGNTNESTEGDGGAGSGNANGASGPGASGGQMNDGGATGGPVVGEGCEGKAKGGVAGALPTFKKETLSSQVGAAYLKPYDTNGDGFNEYILTTLAEGINFIGAATGDFLTNGGAYVLGREGGPATGTLGTWKATPIFKASDGIGFPNASELFDVDGDNVKDLVIGAGFLLKPTGNIVWSKGGAGGTFSKPTKIAVPDGKCWYHIALPLDIDGDADNDFVSSCHVGDLNNPVNGPSRVEWFENDGKGTFTSHKIGDGGGSLLALYDLDGDGDQDVIAPQFFGPESMVWYEQTGEKGTTWQKHLINNTTGRGFKVKFADMNGDGKVDMLYGNHNNQMAAAPNNVMGIYWFELPPTDKVRTLDNWDAYIHTVHEGFNVFGSNNADAAGAPGMINVGDIDGDCDMDVTASGDGDTGLYVFIQQGGGKFDKVDLFTDNGNQNSGEQHMADLDGDGDLDIIWAVFGPAGPESALSGIKSFVYAFLQD